MMLSHLTHEVMQKSHSSVKEVIDLYTIFGIVLFWKDAHEWNL